MRVRRNESPILLPQTSLLHYEKLCLAGLLSELLQVSDLYHVAVPQLYRDTSMPEKATSTKSTLKTIKELAKIP